MVGQSENDKVTEVVLGENFWSSLDGRYRPWAVDGELGHSLVFDLYLKSR